MCNSKGIKPEGTSPVTTQVGYENHIAHTNIETHVGVMSLCMAAIILLLAVIGVIFLVRYCVKCFNKRVERGVDAGLVRLQQIAQK